MKIEEITNDINYNLPHKNTKADDAYCGEVIITEEGTNGYFSNPHNEPIVDKDAIHEDGRFTSQHCSNTAQVVRANTSTPQIANSSSATTQKNTDKLDLRTAIKMAMAAHSNRNEVLPRRTLYPRIVEHDDGKRCCTCPASNDAHAQNGDTHSSRYKCPGFKCHSWRCVCRYCKCDRLAHQVSLGPVTGFERCGLTECNIADSLGMATVLPAAQAGGAHNAAQSQQPGSASYGYSWVPPGLQRKKVEEYMAQLSNNKVPRVNSQGEKYRERQLMVQLPRQDLAASYCKHLGGNHERKAYEDFINMRNELALDIGYVNATLKTKLECRKCNGVLEAGDMAVMAPKFGATVGWHPACFTCGKCDELLVDLTYCVKDNQIYCERDYATMLKPRCAACDELIFSGEYTKAMNKDWHSDHFCCWQCDQTLTGQRYILRDEHPYCIKCYEDVFANQCDECAKPIGIDSKDLSYKDKHWHEDCFLCSMCKISLVDKPFGSKNDRIFCANCYDQAFATRCDGCGEIFKAGMKKMEYKGKQWHDKCFICALCKNPIGTKSFIPKNEDVYCATCYEEKFATRCTKCRKVITTGGVTYKNEPWHRECFCCTNCSSSLAGQRFTSKDEKPYCANCYGELFAKRCSACMQPITGIGGTKFISFEERHWHNECFKCAQCSSSLVGKGFITDGADILCPECAKARLMAQS